MTTNGVLEANDALVATESNVNQNNSLPPLAANQNNPLPPLAANQNNPLPPLPAGVKPLANQLAGHKFGDKANSHIYGMLDCKDGTILKPVIANKGECERHFYELVYGEVTAGGHYFSDQLYDCKLVRDLRGLIPTYLGLTTLPEHPDVLYIKMVDVTHNYMRPHILDIKIGAKAWAPDCNPEKVQRQKDRCPYLDTIKFQVLGARYYDAETQDPVVKLNLRRCCPDELLHKGFPEIFRGVPSCFRDIVLREILFKLERIQGWFLSQTHLAFRGSSVLIVFEGDHSYYSGLSSSSISGVKELESAIKSQTIIKMIDFVHIHETTEHDNNYLEGISSLIEYFTNLRNLFSTSLS